LATVAFAEWTDVDAECLNPVIQKDSADQIIDARKARS